MTFRWLILAVLLACMGISAVFRHRARREGGVIERRREGAAMMVARAIVALALFLGVVLIVAHPPAMAWAALPLPAWSRWAGALLGLLTIPLCYWVFNSLGSSVSGTVLTKPNQRLVRSGPYRWARHPLYSTGIGLFLAIGLMASSAFVLAMTALVTVLILAVVIPAEERRLLETFGDEYRELCRRTGRLLPRLRWPR